MVVLEKRFQFSHGTTMVSLATRIFSEANFIFAGDPEWKDRYGGYFCVADPTGFPYLIALLGSVSREKAEKYFGLCQEKARRLASAPGCLSSWESRDPDNGKWGGAVRVGSERLIFSFSGLPELGDEAVMLATAGMYQVIVVDLSPGIIEILDKIAARSANSYWAPLRNFLNRYL